MNWLNEMLQNDPDPQESREWIESLKAVIDHDGAGRAHQLLEGMVELTRRAGAYLPFDPTTELHQHHPHRTWNRRCRATPPWSGGSAR
jgi:pyruvate dehydrogenase E1 component